MLTFHLLNDTFLKSNKFETMQFVKPVCEKLRNVYFMTSVFYQHLVFALSQTQVNLFSNKNECKAKSD